MSKWIGSGQLDRPITIRVIDRTAVDSSGRPRKGGNVTISESFSRWAKKRHLRTPNEISAIGQDSMPVADVEFTCRYDVRIAPNCQIVDQDGTVYEVIGNPQEVGRKQWVVINAKAINQDRPI